MSRSIAWLSGLPISFQPVAAEAGNATASRPAVSADIQSRRIPIPLMISTSTTHRRDEMGQISGFAETDVGGRT